MSGNDITNDNMMNDPMNGSSDDKSNIDIEKALASIDVSDIGDKMETFEASFRNSKALVALSKNIDARGANDEDIEWADLRIPVTTILEASGFPGLETFAGLCLRIRYPKDTFFTVMEYLPRFFPESIDGGTAIIGAKTIQMADSGDAKAKAAVMTSMAGVNVIVASSDGSMADLPKSWSPLFGTPPIESVNVLDPSNTYGSIRRSLLLHMGLDIGAGLDMDGVGTANLRLKMGIYPCDEDMVINEKNEEPVGVDGTDEMSMGTYVDFIEFIAGGIMAVTPVLNLAMMEAMKVYDRSMDLMARAMWSKRDDMLALRRKIGNTNVGTIKSNVQIIDMDVVRGYLDRWNLIGHGDKITDMLTPVAVLDGTLPNDFEHGGSDNVNV